MFWRVNQPQGLAHSWLWGTDCVCVCVCVLVMWSREQEDSYHHQPLLLWHTWVGGWPELDPKPWVLESEEKQTFGDFRKKSAFSSALNCLVMPHYSHKKKNQAPVLSKLTHLIIPHAFSIPCRDWLLSCVLPSSHWSQWGLWQQWVQDLTHSAKLLDF